MKKIFFVLFIVLASLIFAEIFVRGYYYFTTQELYSNEEEKCIGEYYAAQLKNKFSNSIVDSGANEVSEEYGVILKQNLRKNTVNETEKNKVIIYDANTNSQRMRALKDYELNKSKTRIAALGDSFTYGHDQPLKFSFPYILENITNLEVLNFGVSSFGVDQMYLRYLNEAKKFNPDIVILNILVDDMARNALHCNGYYKPYFEIENNSLVLKGTPVISKEKFIKTYTPPKPKSYLFALIEYSFERFFSQKNHYKKGYQITEKIISNMKEDLKNQTFIVTIIHYPDETTVSEEYAEKLKSFLQENKIQYLDSKEVFSGLLTKYNFNSSNDFYHGHFTTTGNAEFAVAIKRKLEELEIIKKDNKEYKFVIGRIPLGVFLINEKDNSFIPSFDVFDKGNN